MESKYYCFTHNKDLAKYDSYQKHMRKNTMLKQRIVLCKCHRVIKAKTVLEKHKCKKKKFNRPKQPLKKSL